MALEALRGDKTIQEIATRNKAHPNQVSTWKQRAVEGMREAFSMGAERSRGEHEGEIRDLQAKIGELTVEPVRPGELVLVQPGESPGGKEKANHHFHREPCGGHREVFGEASVAACVGMAIEPRKTWGREPRLSARPKATLLSP